VCPKAPSCHYYKKFYQGEQKRFTKVSMTTTFDQKSRLMGPFPRRFDACLGKSNKKQKKEKPKAQTGAGFGPGSAVVCWGGDAASRMFACWSHIGAVLATVVVDGELLPTTGEVLPAGSGAGLLVPARSAAAGLVLARSATGELLPARSVAS
jgi:hypothetical protein